MQDRSTQNFNCGFFFLWGRECQTFSYSGASAGKSVRMQNTVYRSSEEIFTWYVKVFASEDEFLRVTNLHGCTWNDWSFFLGTAGIMTGAFYSVSTLLNQMIVTHYEVSFLDLIFLFFTVHLQSWYLFFRRCVCSDIWFLLCLCTVSYTIQLWES